MALLIDNNATDNFTNKASILDGNIARHVEVKVNGTQAMEFILQNPGLATIIFLDISIPVANGAAFLHRLEELPVEIRQKLQVAVIAEDGRTHQAAQVTQSNGVLGIYAKPITQETCLTILHHN